VPILVLNSGSSSIKFSFFEFLTEASSHCLFDAELTGMGGKSIKLNITDSGNTGLTPQDFPDIPYDFAKAVEALFHIISRPGMPRIEAVGYRVVHPGSKITDHVRITPEVLKDIEQAIAFAPLHEPAAVEVIRAGMLHFPSVRHFACFDTIFHRTMPEEAFTYPLPVGLREEGVRRYGFHGLSCESVLYQWTGAGRPLPSRMVIAHLGSGCSVTAVRDGRSIDTTMGLTPTGGVVMGTRPGDLDPGLVLYLIRQQKGGAAEAVSAIEGMFNHDCGVVALSSLPNDMKAVRAAAAEGNMSAALALKVFTRSITKAIGAYSFLVGGLDTIVFTGGIGEHDAATRMEVLSNLKDLGIRLDDSLNLAQRDGLSMIHASDSKTTVFIVPAKEDLMIAMHVARMAGSAK
jgi:acetate kinase